MDVVDSWFVRVGREERKERVSGKGCRELE